MGSLFKVKGHNRFKGNKEMRSDTTFANLDTAGQPVINCINIPTGSLNANLITTKTYCERCPDEDTNACNNCNPSQVSPKQDEIMNTMCERFQELRSTVRKRYFGEKTDKDIRSAAVRLSESCEELVSEITNEGG